MVVFSVLQKLGSLIHYAGRSATERFSFNPEALSRNQVRGGRLRHRSRHTGSIPDLFRELDKPETKEVESITPLP